MYNAMLVCIQSDKQQEWGRWYRNSKLSHALYKAVFSAHFSMHTPSYADMQVDLLSGDDGADLLAPKGDRFRIYLELASKDVRHMV